MNICLISIFIALLALFLATRGRKKHNEMKKIIDFLKNFFCLDYTEEQKKIIAEMEKSWKKHLEEKEKNNKLRQAVLKENQDDDPGQCSR